MLMLQSAYVILSLVLGIESLSFFQKMTGGGIPTTRHSNLTGVPSGIPMFCSFSKNWGGYFISFSEEQTISTAAAWKQGPTALPLNHRVLTHDVQFQAKGALPCFVPCNTRVCTSIFLCQRINDQRVDSVFPHQHLMIQVWVDRFPVDQPHQLRGGQTAHLEDKKTVRMPGR